MNVVLPFVNDLADLIKAVWTDVEGPVFSMTQIERRNWLDDIGSGQLTVPYCVVEIPTKTRETGASVSAPTWKITPTIYYITAEKQGGGLVADLLQARMEALSDALLFSGVNGLPLFNYTVIDEPEWDTSAGQPVNAAMLEKQLPYLSGSLSFGAWVVYVNVP